LDLAHPHDRAFSELPLDLCEGVAKGYLPFILRCHFLSYICAYDFLSH
jgi:hypothetical protein